MEMNQGEFTIFNGNTCDHGNMINDSEQTRVSFDFRILPLKKYNPSTAKTSATRGTSFTVGGYYKELR
jgi:ectoine hydroxylase-related dioxygenase (phytanoyl-CoA dioxygenase family)